MWFFGDSAYGEWESLGWVARCLGLSWSGGGVWIGPCWCRVLHHLLRFVADFLGVFSVAGGASGPRGVACVLL